MQDLGCCLECTYVLCQDFWNLTLADKGKVASIAMIAAGGVLVSAAVKPHPDVSSQTTTIKGALGGALIGVGTLLGYCSSLFLRNRCFPSKDQAEVPLLETNSNNTASDNSAGIP